MKFDKAQLLRDQLNKQLTSSWQANRTRPSQITVTHPHQLFWAEINISASGYEVVACTMNDRRKSLITTSDGLIACHMVRCAQFNIMPGVYSQGLGVNLNQPVEPNFKAVIAKLTELQGWSPFYLLARNLYGDYTVPDNYKANLFRVVKQMQDRGLLIEVDADHQTDTCYSLPVLFDGKFF